MGLRGGSSSSEQSGGSSSTMTPAQKEQYERLLSMADQFIDAGGYMGSGNEYLGQAEDALKAMGGYYGDILTGDPDTEALEGALAAQQRAAQAGLDQSLMGVSEQANMAGGAGGSRQSIAEGVAVGESNAALQNQQANTINQFAQQEMDRKMNAAQGLGTTAGAYGQLQGIYESEADQIVKTLAAYQKFISGNMGGTTDSTQWGKSAEGSGGWSGNLFG